jgi:hypothetical protein
VTVEPVSDGQVVVRPPPPPPPPTAPPPTARRRKSGWRNAVAWVLIALAAVLTPMARTSHWLNHTVLSGDQYVSTMAPLAQDRAFTNELAQQVTTAMYASLPADIRSNPAAAGLRHQVRQHVAALMAQPSFQSVWNEANRRAQRDAVAVFTGKTVPGVRTNGAVTVDLTPLVRPIVNQLDHSGIPLFDAIAPTLIDHRQLTVTLMSESQLHEARLVFGVLVHLEWILGIAAAVLVVIGLILSTMRWRLLGGYALGVVVTSIIALEDLVGVRIAISRRAGSLHVNQALSVTVFDTVDRYLRRDLWVVMAIGAGGALVLGVGALVRRWIYPKIRPGRDSLSDRAAL